MNTADDSAYCRLDTSRFSPEPALFFVFGASGDLASRKIFPALYDLYLEKQLPSDLLMVGAARREYSTEEFREIMHKACVAHSRHKAEALHEEAWRDFSRRIFYFRNDVEDASSYAAIRKLVVGRDRRVLAGLSPDAGLPENTLYYLAVTPEFFPVIAENLGRAGCGSDASAKGWRRLVVEKPYGKDQQSAARLTEALHRWFDEREIYRIDHYLGKEAVQNLLHFRFANTMFEPVWNRNYIDRIEITVAEQDGIGARGGYYDGFGAARDMLQNHLTQLLCLTVMEPPASLSPEHIRDEKVKVLRSIREIPEELSSRFTVRGQYHGYRAEPGVKPHSETETFAAVQLFLDNWRWQGVPFYLRSGKMLKEKLTEIIIRFRRPPLQMFDVLSGVTELSTNHLGITIQPDEGIHLRFMTKVPDGGMMLRPAELDFHYGETFRETPIPESYERLLLDALSGDASLFARKDEIGLAWKFIDGIRRGWIGETAPALQPYEQGSWGPPGADRLLWKDSRWWEQEDTPHRSEGDSGERIVT